MSRYGSDWRFSGRGDAPPASWRRVYWDGTEDAQKVPFSGFSGTRQSLRIRLLELLYPTEWQAPGLARRTAYIVLIWQNRRFHLRPDGNGGYTRTEHEIQPTDRPATYEELWNKALARQQAK